MAKSEDSSKETPETHYSVDETRAMFVQHADNLVDYWNKVDLSGSEFVDSMQGDEQRWRIAGVVHSLFAAMDGSAIGIPAFDLKARPCDPEDVAPRLADGLKQFTSSDIAGNLASDFHAMNKPDHPLANFKKEYQRLYQKHLGIDKFFK